MKVNKKDILVYQNVCKNFKEIILCLLYPRTCVLCGVLDINGYCDKCKRDIPIGAGYLCHKCSMPLFDKEKDFCEACVEKKFFYHQGRSLWRHKGLAKQSIYGFKYHNRRIYGETYARLLVEKHKGKIVEWQPECIIGVPIHSSRKKSRGYNQADILAQNISKELSKQLNIEVPFVKGFMKRNKTTGFQKKLNDIQRTSNIYSVFQMNYPYDLPKRVLLVDDIYTTGATVNEVAKVLRKSGVKEVNFLVVSIGQGN